MRVSTYRSPRTGQLRVGFWQTESIFGLGEETTLVELVGRGQDAIADAAARAFAKPFEEIPSSSAELAAPVPVPPSIRDFMAFEEHLTNSAAALGRSVDPEWYKWPVFYFSNPAAARGPKDSIAISPGSKCFDYELEIAAVIGLGGTDLDPSEAEEHIAGYTILCDWSARDIQKDEMRHGLGPVKGKDGATSFGPYLLTPDELEPLRKNRAFDLEMSASVNGKLYSHGNLADIYWSFADLLAYASRGTSLVPGDVIGSGTVGTGCILELSLVHGEAACPWLEAGDSVVLEIERLGKVEASIRPPVRPKPLEGH